ncbi:MAG TPA: hypothetical protein VF520_13405 [Thermoleophilaceae bacterium]|jgi:hypothetical protein
MSPRDVAPGNHAGWVLRFENDEPVRTPVTTITSDMCYASIEATLPGGLEGGSYTFAIEGLPPSEHKRLGADQVVTLYLFWRDVDLPAAGYLANVAGLGTLYGSAAPIRGSLVAELSVTKVTRSAGDARYLTRIEAVERAYARLASYKLEQPVGTEVAPDVFSKARQIAGAARVPLARSGSTLATGGHLEPRISGVEALAQLARRVEEADARYGRGVVLIRDGTVHFGMRRIPLAATTDLTLGGGLVEVRSGGKPSGPRKRPVWDLTLKGRPDLKPGDVVHFDVPSELESLSVRQLIPSLGAQDGDTLSADATYMYVESVRHVLSRAQGFVTAVSGVSLGTAMPLQLEWDTARGHQPRSADSSAGAAAAVRDVAGGKAESRAADVGEVREAHVQGGPEPPSQTMRLWRGLAAGDGNPGAARRLEIQRNPAAPVDGVPYATPFAWGRYGLVLPRYPGTRAVMLHREGRVDDPIDVGSLWKSGDAPESEPGDWWLILPAGVPAPDRTGFHSDADVPQAAGVHATNDLVDADGRRIVEVAELTIRVGEKSLADAGLRPEPGDPEKALILEHRDAHASIVVDGEGGVTVSAKDGRATIVMTPAGEVTVAGKEVAVKAEDRVSLGSANIEIRSSGELSLKGKSIALEAHGAGGAVTVNAKGDVGIDAANVKVGVTGVMGVGG